MFNPVLDSEGDSNTEDAPVNPPHLQCSPSPELPPDIPDNALNHSPSPDPPPDVPPDATALNRQSPLPDPPDPSLNIPIAF